MPTATWAGLLFNPPKPKYTPYQAHKAILIEKPPHKD